MRRRFLTLLYIAAGTTACADNLATAPAPPAIIKPVVIRPGSSVQSFVGTIELFDGRVWLLRQGAVTEDSAPARLALEGTEARPLRNLAGSEVEIRGTSGVDAFMVSSFSIRAIDGLPAADGLLEATEDGSYALRLIDNSLRMIMNPPAELRMHVGKRVWVAGPPDEAPVKFGVISYT